MKTRILKFFITISILMMLIPASANAGIISNGSCGENITWTLDDEGHLALQGSGAMYDYTESTRPWTAVVTHIKSLEISNGITSIGDWTFTQTYITDVTIPNGVTSIGKTAFAYCPNLKTVTMPDTVTTIKESAFNRCTSLSEITMSKNLKTVGRAAFEGCENLDKIHIYNIASWCNITFEELTTSSPLYYGNLYINNEPVTSLVIPNTVTKLNNYAFSGSDTITEVTIPTSVKTFGLLTFSNCPNLKKVNLPSNLTSIPDNMFANCSNLTEIEIPKTVTSIGASAFYGCGFENLTIPDNIKTINTNAFYYCKSLKNLTIGSGVTSIGTAAFYGCDALENIYWKATSVADTNNNSNGVFGAANRAYNNLTITFADGVKKIPAYMFYKCTGLENAVISDSVTSIGTYAFYGCKNMKEFTIGKGVTSIGNAAFSGCTAVDKIHWNAVKVTDFASGNNIFSNCGNDNKILEVVFGENVTHVPAYAFNPNGSNFTSLNNITMEKGITSIGKYAFGTCNNLKTVYYIGTSADYAKMTISTGNNYLTSTKVKTFYTQNVNVGFDVNVNTGVSGSTTIAGGKTITISSEIPKRTGYTFLGWATTADAKTPQYQPGNTIQVPKDTEDFILYAVWNKTSYTTTQKTSTGFSVTPAGISKSNSIILICFNNGNFVKAYEKKYTGSSPVSFDVDIEYDDVKVIVWGNTASMIPVSEAEDVSL